MDAVHGERTLTNLDHARLQKLAVHLPTSLAQWLSSAELTDSHDVSTDLVTMNSRVEVVDVHTRRRQVLTVCYPDDAEPAAGFISVLSPVGSSLLVIVRPVPFLCLLRLAGTIA